MNLLICSNNINTASGVSKYLFRFLLVVDLERDTLTERITDNMMELATKTDAGSAEIHPQGSQ